MDLQYKAMQTLFNIGEQTCITNDVFDTDICHVFGLNLLEDSFFSINPLKGPRCDANVGSYRNFLLEFDQGSRNEQLQYIQDLEIPYSTLTWSGSKSVHVIISLAEPCGNRADYDRVIKRIMKKVTLCDQSTKNPSRFSRLPGGRHRNGNLQEILEVSPRVTRMHLETWLGPDTAPNVVIAPPRRDNLRIVSAATNYFLAFGAAPGSWNSQLFRAGCDMARVGFEPDEIYAELESITGHLDAADRRTIASALKAVDKELE